ncbi:MAG: hypothetical protein IPM69_07425 [Ignavibacteria bacterium]|nr:hypothetical protein [Ignavibacteria bacterium]
MPFFLRKLWLKIALPTAMTTFICVEIVVRFLLNQSLDLTRAEVQKNLSNIASQASVCISASDHVAALSNSPDTSTQASFDRIRMIMNKMRMGLRFVENWYTLMPNHGDTTWFGVMSHPESFPVINIFSGYYRSCCF